MLTPSYKRPLLSCEMLYRSCSPSAHPSILLKQLPGAPDNIPFPSLAVIPVSSPSFPKSILGFVTSKQHMDTGGEKRATGASLVPPGSLPGLPEWCLLPP